MNYYLYKLKFSSPVHFGTSESSRSIESADMTLRADTLFSALCHTALKNNVLDKLISLVTDNKLLFSDTMPYFGDELYIPKPALPVVKHVDSDPSERKKMKKLKYIPISMLGEFTASLKGEVKFDTSSVKKDFGSYTAVVKVAVSGNEQTRPYSVGAFCFYENCGIYGITGYESDESLDLVKKLLAILGFEGIGGKTSSGYGKFTVDDEIYLDTPVDNATEILKSMLNSQNVNQYILLTTALPNTNEIEKAVENAKYQLVRRSGFIFSDSISNPVKKQTQYFFAAGSVFDRRFSGDLYDVGLNMPHSVYRYSKPIFLGVNV